MRHGCILPANPTDGQTLVRPLQGRMNRGVPQSVGGATLAHGYSLSALRAEYARSATPCCSHKRPVRRSVRLKHMAEYLRLS